MNLRNAINSNLLGTKGVLDLAEGIEKLEVFVDISTTYCHDEEDILEENTLPALHNPQDVINCVKWMSDDLLNKLQPDLIKPFPNTYGYTKNLVEELVSQYKDKFTIAIARPSIVVAAYKEPVPGWVDNINGPSGVLYAGAKGVIHSSYCKKSSRTEAIPVDIVVNGCILLAYTTATERPKHVNVCNIAGLFNNIAWRKCVEIMTNYSVEYPLSDCMWYPWQICHQYRFMHKISEFFIHFLPAYFIDFLLLLFRQKTFMVGLQRRLQNGMQLHEYYSNRTWSFKNDKFHALKTLITEEENKIFYTDMSKISVKDYLKIYYMGMREFIAKEDLSTLPRARQQMKRLYYVHTALKIMFYILFVYLAYRLLVQFL